MSVQSSGMKILIAQSGSKNFSAMVMSATGQACSCRGTNLELDTAEAKTIELAGTLTITLPNFPPVYFTEKEIHREIK